MRFELFGSLGEREGALVHKGPANNFSQQVGANAPKGIRGQTAAIRTYCLTCWTPLPAAIHVRLLSVSSGMLAAAHRFSAARIVAEIFGLPKMCFPQVKAEKEIFILDDDAAARETLRMILKIGGYSPVCFVDEASLRGTMRRRCPACIILDVSLPGRSGLEIMKDLADYPAPVLMTSGHGDIATAVAAIKNGAFDFIQKPFKGRDLLIQLETVVAGFLPRISEALKERISSLNFPAQEPLTGREREVLQLIAAGSSNKDIGIALGISHRTVEQHRSQIMRKMDVRNVAELLLAVFRKAS